MSAVVLLFCTAAWTGPTFLIIGFCQLVTSHFHEFDEIFRLHVSHREPDDLCCLHYVVFSAVLCGLVEVNSASHRALRLSLLELYGSLELCDCVCIKYALLAVFA